MFVTIGVLCYNNSDTIIQTLNSIKDQTYDIKQIIIIDDCSSDNSVKTITEWLNKHHEALDVAFVRNERNAGIVAGIKKIIDLAKGEILCFIAGDDLYDVTRIENVVNAFQSEPDEFGYLYSDAKIIDIDGNIVANSYLKYYNLEAPGSGYLYDQLLDSNFIPALTLAYRKKSVHAIKDNINPDLLFEDYQMTLLCSKLYKAIFLPSNDVCYRIHGSSTMSTRHKEVLRDKIYFLMSEMDRSSRQESKYRLKKIIRNDLILFMKTKQDIASQKDLTLIQKAKKLKFFFPAFFIRHFGKNRVLNGLLYRYLVFFYARTH